MIKRFRFISLVLSIFLAQSSFAVEQALLSDDSLRAISVIPVVDMKQEFTKSDGFLKSCEGALTVDTASTSKNSKDNLLADGNRLKQVATYLIANTKNINLIQLEFNRLTSYSSRISNEIEEVDQQVSRLSALLNEANTRMAAWQKTTAYYTDIKSNINTERINGLIDELNQTKDQLETALNTELAKQEELLAEQNEVELLLRKLAERQNNFLTHILEPSQSAIWKSNLTSNKQDSTVQSNKEVSDVLGLTNWKQQFQEFVEENKTQARYHTFLSLLIFIALFSFRGSITEAKIEIEKLNVIVSLFKMPLLSWCLITIILTFLIYPTIPFGLRPILLLTASIPTLILGLRIVQPVFRATLLIILVLYNTDQLIEIYGNGSGYFRLIMLTESIAGAVAMFFAFKAQKEAHSDWPFFLRSIVIASPYIGGLFIIASFLNVFGYMVLAQIITSVIANAFMTALIILILIRTSNGMLHMLLTHSFLNKLHVVDNYKDLIQKRLLQVLNLYFVAVWVIGILRKAMLAQPASLVWNNFYNDEYTYGALSVSVRNITEFFLVLFGSAVLANVIRAILQEDLLIHFNLKRGVPKAIAMVTKYTLLVIGFFLAISSMGVDVDKLSFLAGGLGVGIGFGLQNIVGNFISGLILIFERPIHEGDVIVAGTTEGEVKEIGLRSCTVRSWDGAEVIVPNQEFISSRVVNWTLSDAQRRKELLVKTKLGANPSLVVDTLLELVKNRTDIISFPEPMVLYLGNSEFSHDFRVLFWLNSNLLKSSSEIALAIQEKLAEMDVANPIPIHEIKEHKKAD